MDAANLLRAYHRALDEAKTEGTLRDRHVDFVERHKLSVFPTPPAWVKTIRSAHRARVKGEGSPALCDEALARAIKDLGNV